MSSKLSFFDKQITMALSHFFNFFLVFTTGTKTTANVTRATTVASRQATIDNFVGKR
jgi:hypothetical protein